MTTSTPQYLEEKRGQLKQWIPTAHQESVTHGVDHVAVFAKDLEANADIKQALEKTSTTGDSQGTIANLQSQLREVEEAEKARRGNQRLRRLVEGPDLLGVWGSVATPGVFLVVGRIRNSCCKSFNRRPFLYLVGNVGWQFNSGLPRSN